MLLRFLLSLESKEMHSIIQSQLIHIKIAFVTQPIVEILPPYRAVDSYHVLVPIKRTEYFKEFLEKLNFIVNLSLTIPDTIVVIDVDHKCVQTVCSHAS